MRLQGKTLMMLMLLTGLLIFTGCAKNQEPPPPEPVITDVRNYFPTEPALTWSYEGTGNEYASFTRRVLYRQENQVQMVEDNGGTRMGLVYKMTTDAITQTLALEEFYSDQNLLHEKSNRNQILLKAPLKAGATWQDSQDKREIISISETVQVPAGSFQNVVKIKITPLDPQQKHQLLEYYAPHTGLIMREFIADDYYVTSKLASFEKTASSNASQP